MYRFLSRHTYPLKTTCTQMRHMLFSKLRTRPSVINSNSNVGKSLKYSSRSRGTMATSDLAHIEVKDDDPFVLFKEWQQEAIEFSTALPGAFCLATVSKDGKVTARNLMLRRLDEDGFVFMTDRRSQKSKNLKEVPSAAMCFSWAYKNDIGESVSRQVRIEGLAAELEKADYRELYDREPLYCKIRSYICNQGTKVEWDELKASHDQLLRNVESGNADLPMPDNVVGYKLTPSLMDCYHARDNLIADRVLFSKNSATGKWSHHHLAA